MANKLSAGTASPARHYSRGVETISGTFTTNNTSDPTQSVNEGAGFTVARTGVGVFRVTLPRAYRRVLFADAQTVEATRIAKITARAAGSAGATRVGASFDVTIQSAINTPVETTGVVVMFKADMQSVVNHRGNA
jgi:hypothetical protein